MPYTTTNWTNVTTAIDVLSIPNSATGGWFYTGILFMIVFVVIIATIPFGITTALFLGGFIGLILGFFLVTLGLASLSWIATFVGLILLIAVYLAYSNKE